MQKARDIALSKGLHYVYTGNVHDTTGASTYCPSCKKLLIERDWFVLGEYNLKNNHVVFADTISQAFLRKPPEIGEPKESGCDQSDMKILSWNVNGIRAIEKKGFFEWLQKESPDILCLQETKAHPGAIDRKIY